MLLMDYLLLYEIIMLIMDYLAAIMWNYNVTYGLPAIIWGSLCFQILNHI